MPWPSLPSDFAEKDNTAWVTCLHKLFAPAREPEVRHSFIKQPAHADELGFFGVVVYSR